MFATPLPLQQLRRLILGQPLPRIYRVASKETRPKLDFKIGQGLKVLSDGRTIF
jgi:hypothetical protein